MSADLNLDDCERTINAAYASAEVLRHIGTLMLLEVIRLRHELNDPRFMYAGSRILRAAVTFRDREIEVLRAKLQGCQCAQAAEKT